MAGALLVGLLLATWWGLRPDEAPPEGLVDDAVGRRVDVAREASDPAAVGVGEAPARREVDAESVAQPAERAVAYILDALRATREEARSEGDPK